MCLDCVPVFCSLFKRLVVLFDKLKRWGKF